MDIYLSYTSLLNANLTVLILVEQPAPPSVSNLRQSFFPLARAEKMGEKVEKWKAKMFRVKTQKLQIFNRRSVAP